MSYKLEYLDLEQLQDDEKFKILLHRKTIGKTITQRTSMRKYYRDVYIKKGKIPQSLYYNDGRKLSGRKLYFPKKLRMNLLIWCAKAHQMMLIQMVLLQKI